MNAPREDRAPRAELHVGDEAWCVVQTDPTPSGRRTVVGVARVRVLEVPDGHLRITYRVEVVRGSEVVVGTKLEMRRAWLYAVRDREERAAFGREVRRLWPSLTGLRRSAAARCAHCGMPLPADYEGDRVCPSRPRGERGEVYGCAAGDVRAIARSAP